MSPRNLWLARVVGGPRLVYSSFVNTSGAQSYPLPYSYASTVRASAGMHVEADVPWQGTRVWSGQTRYPMCFVVPHEGAELQLQFAGIGLRASTDEWWGLDNVGVELLGERPSESLTEEELSAAWVALGSDDIVAVYDATRRLIASGDRGAAFLRDQLGWRYDAGYRREALEVTAMLEQADRSVWEELGEVFRTAEPRIWPFVASVIDRHRSGEDPPPYLHSFFDGWDVTQGPPDFLREARVAHILERIGTKAARRALLLEGD